jgi:hypothetical protein
VNISAVSPEALMAEAGPPDKNPSSEAKNEAKLSSEDEKAFRNGPKKERH